MGTMGLMGVAQGDVVGGGGGADAVLLETGDTILLETGDQLLLE